MTQPVELFPDEPKHSTVTFARARTTTLRLQRGRPVHVIELPAAEAFLKGGVVPQPAFSVPVLAAVRKHVVDTGGAARAGEARMHLLCTGHHEDEKLAQRRADATLALVTLDRQAWLDATRAARVDEWTAAATWAKAEGAKVDPNVASSSAGWLEVLETAAKAAARTLGRPREALTASTLRFAAGCGKAWPPQKVRLAGYPSRFEERVDVLCFAAEDRPEGACHEGPACAPDLCDVYRKGKYRVERLGAPPAPASGAFLDVRIVNGKELPLAGVLVRYTLPGGASRGALTNDDGLARLDTFPHTEGEVVIDLPEFPGSPKASP